MLKRFDFEEWQRVMHVRGMGIKDGAKSESESEDGDGDWRSEGGSEAPTLVGENGRKKKNDLGVPPVEGGESSDASSSSPPHTYEHECQQHYAPLQRTLPVPHWLAQPEHPEPTVDWFPSHPHSSHPPLSPLDKGKSKATSTPPPAPTTPLLEETLLAMRSIPIPLTQRQLDLLKLQMFIDWKGEIPGFERAMLRTGSLMDSLREMEKDRELDGVLDGLEEGCGSECEGGYESEGESESDNMNTRQSGTMVEVGEDDAQAVSSGAAEILV